jgi:hypothetical protein
MQGIAGLPELDHGDRIVLRLFKARGSGFLFLGNARYGSSNWMPLKRRVVEKTLHFPENVVKSDLNFS